MAPAGNFDALVAAVTAGANAVYLGGKTFGARAFADNFDAEELKRAVKFAHLHDVAVHVTANTGVKDEELNSLAEYLRFLQDIDVDAALLQDLGALRVAKKAAPKLALHASTQMSANNLPGVNALYELGFSRVVLARELSLDEIEYISQNAPVEIEIFAHGAICVCYSGQCLMSSMIGGRSANRGRCAQPCRLPYNLVDEKGKNLLKDEAGQYLLSPKDLNTIDILPQIIKTGVASLKIEGRMKRPEYVAIVTDVYRRGIDRATKGEEYFVPDGDKRALAQIFNRDFTHAYLEGQNRHDFIGANKPNNRGLFVGRAEKYDNVNRTATVKLAPEAELNPGDEVNFWVKVGGYETATITEPSANGRAVVKVPHKVGEGDRVFKVHDEKLSARARGFFDGTNAKKMPVMAKVTAKIGEVLSAEFSCGNVKVAVFSDFVGEAAKNRPLTEEIIKAQMGKLGDTEFFLQDFSAKIDDNVAAPLSALNALRRMATAALEEKLLKKYATRLNKETPRANISWRRGKTIPAADDFNIIVAANSEEKARAAIESGADAVLFGGFGESAEEYENAAESVKKTGGKIYFALPRIMPPKSMGYAEKLLQNAKVADGIYVANIGELKMAAELTELPIFVDWSLIAMNCETLKLLRDLGAAGASLSPELNFPQIEETAKHSPLLLECFVYGRLELMVSKYCPVGAFLGGKDKICNAPCRKRDYFLQDRKNILFPVKTDAFCEIHILNSRPHNLLEHIDRLKRAGIVRLRLDARFISEKETVDVVSKFRRAARGEKIIFKDEENTYTRGHYFRGTE